MRDTICVFIISRAEKLLASLRKQAILLISLKPCHIELIPLPKIMDDIQNYSANSNQLEFTKEISFQKDIEESALTNARRSPLTLQSTYLTSDNSAQPRNQALLQLLKSYAAFMNESSDVKLDMNAVLNDLLEMIAKLKPPPK